MTLELTMIELIEMGVLLYSLVGLLAWTAYVQGPLELKTGTEVLFFLLCGPACIVCAVLMALGRKRDPYQE